MHDNLFQNKYRVESARLQNDDYAQDGLYFVTPYEKLLLLTK